MSALSLSLLSAFSGALAALLTKPVLRYTSTRNYLSVNFAVLFVLLLPAAPWAFALNLTPGMGALLLLTALIDVPANYFYFRAFEVLEAGPASVLLSLAPLFALTVAPLVGIAGALDAPAVGGILLTAAGVAILNRAVQSASNTGQSPHPTRRSYFLIPLASSAIFGVNVYLVKYILCNGSANPYTFYLIRTLIIAVLSHLLWRPDLRWVTPRALVAVAGRGVFVAGKWLLFLYAVALGAPALIQTVGEVTPLFVVILAALFLKEPFTRAKLLGVALVVAGLWLIAV